MAGRLDRDDWIAARIAQTLGEADDTILRVLAWWAVSAAEMLPGKHVT
jgi:hypothetical protein